MMGSRGHMEKQMPHEESIRVPFYVHMPNGKQGVNSETLFGSIDIYPSVCGLAGIPAPAHCRGSDLSAALKGETVAGPEHVFLTNQTKPNSPEQFAPTYRGVRTATHTYAVAESGRWILFDNIVDPYQLNNLIKDKSQVERIASFDAAIEGWVHSTGDRFPYKAALKSYADYPDFPAPDRG